MRGCGWKYLALRVRVARMGLAFDGEEDLSLLQRRLFPVGDLPAIVGRSERELCGCRGSGLSARARFVVKTRS